MIGSAVAGAALVPTLLAGSCCFCGCAGASRAGAGILLTTTWALSLAGIFILFIGGKVRLNQRCKGNCVPGCTHAASLRTHRSGTGEALANEQLMPRASSDRRVSRQVRVHRGPADRSSFAVPAAGLRARVRRKARVCLEHYFPWVICERAGRGLLPSLAQGLGPAVPKAGDLRRVMGYGTCGAQGGEDLRC